MAGSTRRKDQKGGCAADSVAKPARCQRARPRCCTCSRVLPTTDTMPASKGTLPALDGIAVEQWNEVGAGPGPGPGPETRG